MSEQKGSLQQLIDELCAVLVEERRLLLDGTPARITTITERKLALAEAIDELTADPNQPRPERDTLLRLDRYNRENAIICDAMLRHFTAAIDSLRLHEPHRSYTLSGGEQKARPVPLALGTA